jgi:hypothetical protein
MWKLDDRTFFFKCKQTPYYNKLVFHQQGFEDEIEKQTQVIQVQESRIKEHEARLDQNSKNSHKQLPVIYLRKRRTVRHPAGKVAVRQVMREAI